MSIDQIQTVENMSLRDWFAGMAIQGMLSCGYSRHDVCELAYETADAMLKAREAQP